MWPVCVLGTSLGTSDLLPKPHAHITSCLLDISTWKPVYLASQAYSIYHQTCDVLPTPHLFLISSFPFE